MASSGPHRPAGERTIAHVDMDAFYASVELLRHPELQGRPVIVGGAGARGVVAAASYEARSYGVRSAMPSVRAQRMCPGAVFLDGDHPHYQAVSARVMAVFESFSPLVEPLSLDEAFLDVSGMARRLDDPSKLAQRIRTAVFEAEGLHCSVGVAPNKFLAKLATNSAKPRPSRSGPVRGEGVRVVAPGTELDFLHPLPVGELWGVGPATLARLTSLGIATVGDLARTDLVVLRSALGPGSAQHLSELANGIDDRPVVAHRAPKSVSHEETFRRDVLSLDDLRPVVSRHAEAVASRLRRSGLKGRTVQVKVRFGDFSTTTRSATLVEPTDRGTDIVATAWELVERIGPGSGVRLLGVGVSGLGDADEPDSTQQVQLSFDELADPTAGDGDDGDTEQDWDAANDAVDAIRERFGQAMIRPARLADQGERGRSAQWGPGDDPSEGTQRR